MLRANFEACKTCGRNPRKRAPNPSASAHVTTLPAMLALAPLTMLLSLLPGGRPLPRLPVHVRPAARAAARRLAAPGAAARFSALCPPRHRGRRRALPAAAAAAPHHAGAALPPLRRARARRGPPFARVSAVLLRAARARAAEAAPHSLQLAAFFQPRRAHALGAPRPVAAALIKKNVISICNPDDSSRPTVALPPLPAALIPPSPSAASTSRAPPPWPLQRPCRRGSRSPAPRPRPGS